jgi:hypothetical protein
MAGVNLTDLDSFGALHELYSSDREYQENVQNTLWNKINKDQSDIKLDGKNFKIEVSLQLNESYGAITDDEPLPLPGQTKSDFANYSSKNMYSSFEATQKALTRGWAGGITESGKYADRLLKETLISFVNNINQDLYQNGRGLRAVIASATPAATSFVVDSAAPLRPGMILDWYNAALTVKRGTIRIAVKSIDRMTKTTYIDTTYGTAAVPAGAVADDVLVVAGSLAAGEPPDGRHIAGLARITDNTVSLGGLSAAIYAAWAAVNQSAGNGNISQELLQLQWDSMYIIGGRYPNMSAFNTAQKRAYLAPFLNQRQFTSNSFDTGAASLTFSPLKMGEDEKNQKPGSITFLEDKDCPPDVWYFWSNDDLILGTDYYGEPHLADEDGETMRFRPSFDSMQGFYRFWANTVVRKRSRIGKISGLAVPTGTL